MKHALCSPSSAYRWLNCPQSVFYQDTRPPGQAAERGTRLHELAYQVLTGQKALGRLTHHDRAEIQHYVELVDTLAKSCDSLLLETTIWHPDFPEICFGTADAVIVNRGVLHVVDLKTGEVGVKAYKNPQLTLYAYMALARLRVAVPGIRSIALYIAQTGRPLDAWRLTVAELERWHGDVVWPVLSHIEQFENWSKAKAGAWCEWCPGKRQGCEAADLAVLGMF